MLPLSQFGPDVPETIAAMAFFMFVAGVPLIWLLLNHQRKMAELLNRQAPGELEEMRAQVHHLAQLVHQNTLALDDLKSRLPAPSEPTEARIEQRLHESGGS